MEAGTDPAREASTGSRTIADLLPLAAEKFGDAVAVRQKVDEEWVDDDLRRGRRGRLGDRPRPHRPRHRARRPGLHPVQHAPRVELRVDFGDLERRRRRRAGLPDELPARSASGSSATPGAVAVVCEDAAQVAKIAQVRDGSRPAHDRRRSIPSGDIGDAVTLDDVRERGRGRRRRRARAPRRRVAPEDPFTFIYTSGTTGPPKGCVLSHGNYRVGAATMVARPAASSSAGDVVYLFLPLAHAFALLIELLGVRPRRRRSRTSAATRRRSSPSSPETKPAYFPSVPRIFEKLYTLGHAQHRRAAEQRSTQAVAVGRQGARAPAHGQEVPAELQRAVRRRPTSSCSPNVRALFGGELRQASTGAAPIAQEILEFFYAGGVPVLEGYGMTETVDRSRPTRRSRTTSSARSAARCPGVRGQDRRRRRGPHQGREHLRAATARTTTRSPRRSTRGLAAHRRPRRARRGRLPLDHRPQEGHHHHRGRQEPRAREPRERPQAVALDLAGRHARRPAPLPRRARSRSTRRRWLVGRSEHGSARGHPRSLREPRRCASYPGDPRRGEREVRPGRADQEVHDPRARPLPGDGRAHAHPEGQAQRRQREVRRRVRLAVRVDTRLHEWQRTLAYTDEDGPHRYRRPVRRPPPRHAPDPLPGAARAGSAARQAVDRVISFGIQLLMVLVNLTFWGPLPAGVAVGRVAGPVLDRQRRSSRSSPRSPGCIASLLIGPRDPQAPGPHVDPRPPCRGLRPAQRDGWESSSPSCCVIGTIAFTFWLLIIAGPGSSVGPANG